MPCTFYMSLFEKKLQQRYKLQQRFKLQQRYQLQQRHQWPYFFKDSLKEQ